MIDDINDSSGTSDFKQQSDMTDFRNLLKKRASNHSQFYRRLSSVPTIKRFTDQNTFYGTNNSATTTADTTTTVCSEHNNDIANVSCVNIINLTEKLSVANITTNTEPDKKAGNEKINQKKIYEKEISKPLSNALTNTNPPPPPPPLPLSSTPNMNQSVQELCCEKKSSFIGCSCDRKHVLDNNKKTALQQLIYKEQQQTKLEEHNQHQHLPSERLTYDIMISTLPSTTSTQLSSHKRTTFINESSSLADNANAIVTTTVDAAATAGAVSAKTIVEMGDDDANSSANTIIIDPPTKSFEHNDDTVIKKASNEVLVTTINDEHNQSLDNNNKMCEQEEWNRSNYLTFVPATSLQCSQQLARCRRRCCCCCSNNHNKKNNNKNNNSISSYKNIPEEDQFDVCCSISGRSSNLITNKEATITILDDLADPFETKQFSDEYEASSSSFKAKFSNAEKKLTEKYSKILRQRKLPIIDSDRELFTIETTSNSIKIFENKNNNNNSFKKNIRRNNNPDLENYTFPCVEKLVKMYTKLLQEKKGGDQQSPRSSIDETSSSSSSSTNLPVQHEEEEEEDLKTAIDKGDPTKHLQISTKYGRGRRLRSLERNDLNPSPISDEGCHPGQSPYSSDYDDNENIPDDNDAVLIDDIDKEKVIRSSSSDSALGLDEDPSSGCGGDRSSSPTNFPTGRRMTLTVTDIPLRSALLPLAEPTSLPDSPTSLTPPVEQIPSVVPINAPACPPERPIVTQTAIPSKVILEERIVEIPEDKFHMQSVSRRESAQSCMSDYNSSEYGGVRYVRTPSVVVSDYSDDVMCGITLEEIEYFRAHRMRRRSSADTQQTEKDDAASDVSAASSCSNLYYCGSTISALDGADCYVNGMRMGVDRKISDCSTCSTVSGDEEDDAFHYDHIREHPNQQLHHHHQNQHHQSQQTQQQQQQHQQQQQQPQQQIRKNKKVGVVDLI